MEYTSLKKVKSTWSCCGCLYPEIGVITSNFSLKYTIVGYAFTASILDSSWTPLRPRLFGTYVGLLYTFPLYVTGVGLSASNFTA